MIESRTVLMGQIIIIIIMTVTVIVAAIIGVVALVSNDYDKAAAFFAFEVSLKLSSNFLMRRWG